MSETRTSPKEFRQQVRMAAVQVEGLRPEELAQALAYEVEPLSGIPAPEAEVTYQPIVDADPTVRVYDVIIRRRTQGSGATAGLDRWLRPALVFAALVILTVIGDGVWLVVRRTALERTVTARRPLQSELDRLNAETRAMRSSAEALRAEREAATRAQDEAAFLRRTHADILGELARACGQGTVLTSIKSGERPHSLIVRAIDVSSEAAAGTMQTLSAHATTNGWQLLPGEIVESKTGATVSFSFELTRAR